MATIGTVLYILSGIGKFMFVENSENKRQRFKFATHMSFTKGDSFAALSALQFLGILWIGIGILENSLNSVLGSIPGFVIMIIEAFLPIIIVFIVARYKMTR